MGKPNKAVELVWAGKGLIATYKLPVFFDTDGQMLVEFTDYMMDFAKPVKAVLASNENTFLARAYDLKAFVDYLANFKVDWRRFDDERFKEFIAQEREAVMAWQAAQKYEEVDENGASINVNRKIDAVYDFYEWAQSEGLVSNLIGADCPIHTLLTTDTAAQRAPKNAPRSRSKAQLRNKRRAVSFRPLRLRTPVSRSTIRHFPTDAEIEQLYGKLGEKASNAYVQERNQLFAAAIQHTAFRAASLASLVVADIPEMAALHNMDTEEKVAIRPRHQKMGHQNVFEVSHSLCMDLRRFIDGPRADLLAELGISPANADSAVFLNVKTGKAMQAKSLRDIVREGFREIGVTERRTGTHAIRRHRGNQKAEDIIRRKRRAGGLVTPEAVGLQLSKEMGHSVLSSFEPYQRGMNALEAETDAAAVAQLREELELQAYRLAAKEAELAAREKRLMQREQKGQIEPDTAGEIDDDLSAF